MEGPSFVLCLVSVNDRTQAQRGCCEAGSRPSQCAVQRKRRSVAIRGLSLVFLVKVSASSLFSFGN